MKPAVAVMMATMTASNIWTNLPYMYLQKHLAPQASSFVQPQHIWLYDTDGMHRYGVTYLMHTMAHMYDIAGLHVVHTQSLPQYVLLGYCCVAYHTHTNTHTHRCSHTHRHSHTHTHTDIHTKTMTHTHWHTHRDNNTHRHLHIDTHTLTYTQRQWHTQTDTDETLQSYVVEAYNSRFYRWGGGGGLTKSHSAVAGFPGKKVRKMSHSKISEDKNW